MSTPPECGERSPDEPSDYACVDAPGYLGLHTPGYRPQSPPPESEATDSPWYAPTVEFTDDDLDIPDASSHAADPVSWYSVGIWPMCVCGYDPHDNTALNAHWAEQGFRVVETAGRLEKITL